MQNEVNSVDTIKPSVEFVICVERGYFEKQAKLLVSCIRSFGGQYADAPIYCYQPRKGFEVSKETVLFLERQGVFFNGERLNKDYATFKFANKPIICAYHEQRSRADGLVYLDCDSLLMNDPVDLLNFGEDEVMVRPEDAKGHGTNPDMTDEHAQQWRDLYEFLEIDTYPTVKTVMDYKETLAYYNAGQIIAPRRCGLFGKWNDNFLRSLDQRLFRTPYLIMSDQMMLSATIVQMRFKVKTQHPGFNFPLNLRVFDDIKNPLYQRESVSDISLLHYHKIFLRGYNPVAEEFSGFEQGRQINRLVEELGLFHFKNSLKMKVKHKLYKYWSQMKYTRKE